jgi:hypothetical protein
MSYATKLTLVWTLLLLLAASSMLAEVPGLINYQGRLTDDQGIPVNGTVSIVFTIYNAAEVPQWSETHPSVTVTDGLFDVILGAGNPANPIHPSTTELSELYLGIKVGADPELTPRVRLTAVPYAFQSASWVVDASDAIKTNSNAGVIIECDQPLLDAALKVYGTGHTSRFTSIEPGYDVLSANDVLEIEVPVTSDNDFQFIECQRGTWDVMFMVQGDGDVDAVGQITANELSITGPTGNSTVTLPEDAISSLEILDEPGIASDQSNPANTLGTDMTDIETVTIVTEAPGYIVVMGKCYVRTYGSTASNYMGFQIDQTTGGGSLIPYWTRIGLAQYPSTSSTYFHVFVHRVYYKPAGTHTFILEGKKDNAAHTTYAYSAIVTAMYFPTSYGSVVTFATGATDYPEAEAVQVIADEDPSVTKTMYKADLRQLELIAARKQAEAIQAERDLLKARLEQAGESDGKQ